MKTLSMLELRQDSRSVISGLKNGESYELTYRGKVVGKLIPSILGASPTPDDPIYTLAELAEPSPEREGLSNQDMDALIYGL